ncbi:MAG: hypothetical protein KKF50_04790 [Nanoarchaeota archaeon]|nr:hypothetical protein [Nanoarchaeota archaeon]
MEDEVVLKIEKPSKDLTKLKEGDKLWINGKEMIVDKHYLFQDHGNTKEMIIEVFNVGSDREYQIRYFDDQVESSIEVYELQGDFQYVRREPKTIRW